MHHGFSPDAAARESGYGCVMRAARSRVLVLGGVIGAAIVVTAPTSMAGESVVKRPGAHTDYVFEAEPHVLLGVVDPPGPGAGLGIGPGFRGSVEFLDNGPLHRINNTMAVGFGADWVHYSRGGKCSIAHCDDRSVDYIFLPVVLQWNFWLTQEWSVFGEPGLAFRISSDSENRLDTFVLHLGARYNFTRRLAFTMRLGMPAFSAGASFFF